jgi:hypothetical protein
VKLILSGKRVGFLEKRVGFLEKRVGFLEKRVGFLEKAKFAKQGFIYVFKGWGERIILIILLILLRGGGLTTPHPFCETNSKNLEVKIC